MSLLTSLESYWKLDEASGDALDAHGSNTLTDTNTVGSATGKINNARDFEQSASEYFTLADNASLSTGDIDFSFSLWFNAETLANYPVLFAKRSSGGDLEYVLYYDTGSNRLTWQVSSSGGGSPTAVWGSALSTATWYHVVVWHDAAANEIGITVNDGTPVTTGHSTGVRDGSGDFDIGASHHQSIYWDGLIDEVGFWKRVLTSGERTDLYASGSGLAYSSFGGGGTTLTPATASLALTTFAPTVSTPQTLTPSTLALSLTTFAPTVATPVAVTPSTASLSLTTFTPAVTAGGNQSVTPDTLALTLTTFAPSVAAGGNQSATPTTASLTLTTFAPTVSTPVAVTPSALALSLTTFEPTVAVSGSASVTPGTLALVLTMYAPTVTGGEDIGGLVCATATITTRVAGTPGLALRITGSARLTECC